MRRQSQMAAFVLATVLLGCGRRDRGTPETGAAANSVGSDSAAMTGSRSTSDTSGMTGTPAPTSADTNATGKSAPSDSAKGNQSKSGVTNTKTGKSTLGKGVTKTRPDQGQPVTSKGDTVKRGGDTTTHSDTTSQPPR